MPFKIFNPSAGGGTTYLYELLTFDTTGNNFGLVPNEAVVSGATNAYGSNCSLGTTTADIDGLFIYISDNSRHVQFQLFMGAAGTPFVDNFAMRNGGGGRVRIDFPIPAGTTINMRIATTSGTQNFKVTAIGFQNTITPTGTSIAGLGSVSSVNTLGVTLSTPNTWAAIGTLAADAQAIQAIMIGNNGDLTRTAGLGIIDIGIGDSADVTPDNVLIGGIGGNNSTTNMNALEVGPLPMSGLLSGKKLFARAQINGAGTLPDAVNVQLMMRYGVPLT